MHPRTPGLSSVASSALCSQRVGLPCPGNPTKPQPLSIPVPPQTPGLGLIHNYRLQPSCPSEDLDFSYHKRTSVPLLVPAASPTGGKAELFLENSRVCSRTQDGASLGLHPGDLPHLPHLPSLCMPPSRPTAVSSLPSPLLSLPLCLALTLTPSISFFLSLSSPLPSPSLLPSPQISFSSAPLLHFPPSDLVFGGWRK